MLDDRLDCAPPRPAPRYLRFVTALVLGTAAATAGAACGGEDDPPVPIDAPIDQTAVVDGPLPPPDLPRSVA